jgi:hypothetical protein
MLYSCQKESIYPEKDLSDALSKESKDQSAALNKESNNKCRLVYSDFDNGFITETYGYNAKGLVDNIKNDFMGSIYVYATMEYDNKDKFIKGTISYDDITYYDMVFEYQNKQIIREVTYEPGTTNMIDLVTNTYNNKGQLVRREDAVYDLYTTFEYDAAGNNTKSDCRFISSDFLLARIVYHFNKHIKDAETARPGLSSCNWWYINEIISPFEPTERDEYWGDGEGGEFLAYDEDPAKTVINPTTQNLAGDRLSFDNIFGVEKYHYWVFENCGGKNESTSSPRKSIPKIDQRTRDIAQMRMPLLRGPQLKKQLEERKSIMQRLRK